jgi:hypothetical protein
MPPKPMILAALQPAASLVNLDPRRHAAACHA